MYQEIYDNVNWPIQPPNITNDIKETTKTKHRKRLCKNYFKQCWKLCKIQ
jgi:hypothetical protein